LLCVVVAVVVADDDAGVVCCLLCDVWWLLLLCVLLFSVRACAVFADAVVYVCAYALLTVCAAECV